MIQSDYEDPYSKWSAVEMEDLIGLCNRNGKSTVIYTQFSGESESFENLSLVSKRRLAAMYKIYLGYLEGELEKVDQDDATRVS